ncbi:MAG: cysteine desulfurase [Bacilli bacterium]|jgi:cysteine desulfurase / selenocysteine lyase
MLNVEEIRKDFPMFKNNENMQGHRFCYLDNAATSFKPQSVIDACDLYYEKETANAHRGDYDLAYSVDTMVDSVREKVAKFINAKKEEIVFTSGASMSLNLIAFGYGFKFLKEGDEILLTEAEHASNVLPWFKVKELTKCSINYIPLSKEGRLTPDALKKVINKHTKIVSVAQVTNVLGYKIDIKAIAKICHDNGTILVVDGAQSVPHMKVDVKDLDCDFIIFSGHKMCGPTGTGVMYGKFNLLCEMNALMVGGGDNARFDLCGNVALLEPPAKFEAGTQNLAGIYGLGAAVDYLSKIGMDNVEEYETELRKYAISKLEELDNVIIYNKEAETGIITINVKGVFPQDEATYLNSKGICVRSGQHCAKLLLDFLKTVGTVRISLYFYNNKADIDQLVDALKTGGNILDAYF